MTENFGAQSASSHVQVFLDLFCDVYSKRSNNHKRFSEKKVRSKEYTLEVIQGLQTLIQSSDTAGITTIRMFDSFNSGSLPVTFVSQISVTSSKISEYLHMNIFFHLQYSSYSYTDEPCKAKANVQ